MKTLRFINYFILLATLIVPLVPITSLAFDREGLIKVDFHANSTRRDLKTSELGKIVSVEFINGQTEGNCAGFSVKNNQNKLYIASARHCANYSVTSACKNEELAALTLEGFSPKLLLLCKRIVAASIKNDIFIFEATILNQSTMEPVQNPESIIAGLTAYNLADYEPAPYTQVKMIGLPADPKRQGRPTVSENCSIMPSETLDIASHAEPNSDRPDEVLQPRGKHNCTVYGGNSGGPIIHENGIDVLGLPGSYHPNEFRSFRGRASFMDVMKDFIDQVRPELEKNGVSLSKYPTRGLSI